MIRYEFLTVMAEYAEARARGRTLPPQLAKAEEHERLCANCREDCGALVEIVRAELSRRAAEQRWLLAVDVLSCSRCKPRMKC